MLFESIRALTETEEFAGLTVEQIVGSLSDEHIDLLCQMQEAEAWDEKYRKFDFLFPDETRHVGNATYFARRFYQKHLEFFRLGKNVRARCFMAGNRVGKALKHGTPVATPGGWRPIETLEPGEEVIAGDGSICRVTGVYPQGMVPLYRMIFDSGDVECCAEHLWKYQQPRARFPYRYSRGMKEANPSHGAWVVGDTRSIIDTVGMRPAPRRRVVIPSCDPWQLPKRDLPLDPWLVGMLLGDGCTIHCAMFSTADAEMVEQVAACIPDGVSVRFRSKYDYAIAAPPGKRNPVIAALRSLDMMGKRSAEKRVPTDYLMSAPEDRVALLRGLMDTDGYISRTGAMEFGTVSHDLAVDVQFLVQSLGGKSHIRKAKIGYRVKVRLNICPFTLPRKAARWNPRHRRDDHILHRIEEAGEGYATCISVDHPDRTFVTAHGIVTHNTFSAGGYEMACHLTGRYPAWWEGRRFRHPIRAWACGKTNETTRDIVQTTLLGDIEYEGSRKLVDGSGVIPRECIGRHNGYVTWKQGVADLIDTIKIKHISGGWSKLGLKSYQQGRGSFEGTAQHVVWDDEEPPMDVYNEQVIRTATTKGIIIVTFTPLQGLSDVVKQFLPDDDEVIG